MAEFSVTAEAGGGEEITHANAEKLLQQLLVLVFGSKHEQDVIKFFRN